MLLQNLTFALGRLRPYVVRRLRCLPYALLALGEAVLQCWPLILLAVLAPLLLALSGQGREALLVSTGGIGLSLFCLIMIGVILTGFYARLIVDSASLRARPYRAKRFAQRCAPDLVAVVASFALPLLLRYGTNMDLSPTLTFGPDGLATSPGWFVQVLTVAGPMFAIAMPALIIGDSPWRLSDDEIAPLVLIGIIYSVTFVATSESSVLTRFVILMSIVVLAFWFLPRCLPQARKQQLSRLKGFGLVGSIYALVIIGVAGSIAMDPVGNGSWWGATNVILMAVLAYLCLGYLLAWGFWWLGRLRCSKENPLLLGALHLALLAAIAWRLLSASFGDEELRTIALDGNNPSSATSYLDQWIALRKTRATKERPYPVFIVTAEGGGIRAAYWTATVLAALQDQHSEFAVHVLALSGVSGGSVGASIFAALVNGLAEEADLSCRKAGGYEACAREIGRGDLLSPPLASMLLAGPLRRLTGEFGQPDRAVALERSLERSWQLVMNNKRFAEPFKNIAANGMLLLPNSTSAGSGQRIVVSSLATDSIFEPAYALDGRPLALSTATLLSARFPAISPAALYEKAPGNLIRIVDGGFSDNSGAATGADVLQALAAALDRAKAKERFRPVVIAITNSAETKDEGVTRGGFRSLTLGALLDPVGTLASVSGTASARFQHDLHTRVVELGGIYLGNMRLSHGEADLPLGWMLAPATADFIDKRLRDLQADTQEDFQRVGKLLDGSE